MTATIVADSISHFGDRLTTMQVTFPRFVLAEFNTHRVFSRNSASSRAIPVAKQLDRIENDPVLPVEWGVNKSGMQAEEVLGHAESIQAENIWLQARDDAVRAARALADLGVHKQITNRLLEPFMWHTVIVTSVVWENFFEQRCSRLAQPEIRVAAEAMREVYLESEPEPLSPGEWHMPYIMDVDEGLSDEELRKVSVARCARVSYLTHDGVRDPAKDLELYDRLVSARPMHASPLEHVATPRTTKRPGGQGNFPGWVQLRHVLEREIGMESYV